MNKFNKKGFTLIEMLVVIAIIAVLVSIIIPTVSSATGKAKAATDAANLRSMLAEATTDYLNGQDDATGLVDFTASSKTFVADTAKRTSGGSGTGAPACKSFDGATISIVLNGSDIEVAYVYNSMKYTIDDFAKVAEAGGTLTGTSISG